MDIRGLKKFLSENPEKIIYLLESLNCHHIKQHSSSEDGYISCGNYDGDNPQAVSIYLTPSLLTINYTREICSQKQSCDFLDLVMFYRNEGLFDTLKWISQTADINYYQDFNNGELPLLKLLRELKEELNRSKNKVDEEDNTPIKPRSENLLSYYFPYVSEMFAEDNISYGTQREWEVHYDPNSNRWVIPVRDEQNVLIGIKGRWFDRVVPEGQLKYVYLESCPRNKVLFGYHRTKEYIKESNTVFILEAEKGCLQFWNYGIRNCVGIGGTRVGQNQIDKISRLGKKLILVFDKDFTEDKIRSLRNKFAEQIEFWAVIDKDGLLGDKESPSDDPKKLEILLKDNVYKIEKGE
jgi:DNA primase